MSFMEQLENMESFVEEGAEEKVEGSIVGEDVMDEIDIVSDFDTLLKEKLQSAESVGMLKSIGEDIDEVSEFLIEDLKKFLDKAKDNNYISDEEIRDIIKEAYSLMGFGLDEVNEKSR